ncbi:MAG: hypothetical protein R2932_01870 [Caldilineaceae bacterium]
MNGITQKLLLLLNHVLVPFAVLMLAVIACYYGIWHAYFATRDDFNILGWIMRQPTLWDAVQGYGNGVRYLLFGIVWIRTQLFGMTPAPYYWTSLVQHALVGLLIYWMVLSWRIPRAQGRLVALMTALFFVTTFSAYEVVTNISASSYSLRTLFYLPILLFFAAYLRRQRRRDYAAALGFYVLLVFLADYALSIPLVLLAYHYTIGQAPLHWGVPRWRDLRIHLPFWLLWVIHVALQFNYLRSGSSEAIYSEAAYTPGLHMASNLLNLVFLLIPNVHVTPIQNFLNQFFSPEVVNLIWQLSLVLALVGHGLALYGLWRGTPVIRFAIALIYLPFLQYTLWQDGYADAPRYLYLSAIGYSILVVLLCVLLQQHLAQWTLPGARWLVPVMFSGYHGQRIFAQIWIRQQVANGQFRRTVVERLARNLAMCPGVPTSILKFRNRNLKILLSCYFVIKRTVTCEILRDRKLRLQLLCPIRLMRRPIGSKFLRYFPTEDLKTLRM